LINVISVAKNLWSDASLFVAATQTFSSTQSND